MFKKIQNHLLLRHPLLWNIKIVPLTVGMLILHVLFFIVGYISGEVDFSEDNQTYFRAIEGYAAAFGILFSVLITVVWLVFYFRNNAYKSYYPKRKNSLYKEWLLILLICAVNWTYPLSLLYAKDLRARSYFTEQEFNRRADVISMASLFADGSFGESGDSIVETEDGKSIQMHTDTFKFNNRPYHLRSLFNKNLTEFSVQDSKRDSINELRVKNWMFSNRKDSVLWVMTEFDKIVREHGARSNITPAKWLELVYHYPNFDSYVTVGRIFSYASDDYMPPYGDPEYNKVYEEGSPNAVRLRDTVSNVIKVKGGRTYIYPKYYVPLRQIENAYQEISSAWTNPSFDIEILIVYTYLALMMSLVIFSFRVTSGKSWLISLLAFGITALVVGIFNMLLFGVALSGTGLGRYGEEIYLGFWLLIIAGLTTYFFGVRKAKKFSAIALNIILWLTPWVLPVIGMMVYDYLRDSAVYDEQGIRTSPKSWLEVFLGQTELFMALSALVFIVYMFVFTAYIKKWKGIPEA